MTSATFTTSIETPQPDPAKHVNFNQGMVLGVEDFTQEFAYLSGRDQWLARDAIGYGTLSGLHVTFDPPDQNSLSVSPGVAINPRGQLIRVTPRQCAKLDAWLALPTTTQRMSELGIAATGDFTAYVVLCYRDCPTDEVPVPGEPCRCDTDTMAPSRITDDFRLELTLTPPPQLEEGAVRDLIVWVRQIELADFEPTRADLDSFLQAIRDAMGVITSPPESPPPDYFYGSPPASLRLPRGALCQWMRAAMRLWVTELRPLWRAQCAPPVTSSSDPCGCHGIGTEPADMECDCILLAAITITRGSTGITGAVIDEEHRPFLVHLRMLEELLLCGPCCGAGCGNNRTFATVFATDAHTLQIWMHHSVALDLPAEAVSLELDDAAITDFTITALGGNFFNLELTASPAPTLSATTSIQLEFDASQIQQTDGRDLATAIREDGYCYPDYSEPRLDVFASGPSGEGEPISVPEPADNLAEDETFGSAGSVGTSEKYARADHIHPMPDDPVPPHDGTATAHRNLQLLGDVTGAPPATVVVGLQSKSVSNAQPNDGDVLTYSSNQWAPKPAAATSAFRVTSGLVIFDSVIQEEQRVSPPIEHGFDQQLVMIRLGLEEDQGTISTEDVDPVADQLLNVPTPHMLARYQKNSKDFVVVILDARDSGEVAEDPRQWRIRWWAVPVTEIRLPDTIVSQNENTISEEFVAGVIPAEGINRSDLIGRLGTSETEIQSVLDNLVGGNMILITGNRITLTGPQP